MTSSTSTSLTYHDMINPCATSFTKPMSLNRDDIPNHSPCLTFHFFLGIKGHNEVPINLSLVIECSYVFLCYNFQNIV